MACFRHICFTPPFGKSFSVFHLPLVKHLKRGCTPWHATLVTKRLSLAEISIYVHVLPGSSAHRSFWVYVDRLLVGYSRSNRFQRHQMLSLQRRRIQDLQGKAQSPYIQTRGHSPAAGGQVSAGYKLSVLILPSEIISWVKPDDFAGISISIRKKWS